MSAALITGTSFGSFTVLYGVIRRTTLCSARSTNALVSGLHAVIMVVVSLLSVMQSDYRAKIGELTPDLTRSILAFSLGYFVYDFLTCLFIDLERKQFNTSNLIHHLFAIAGTSSAVINQRSGTEVLVSIFYAELSTPFLHSRTLLKEQGYGSTFLVQITEGLFALIFTIFRVFICPFLTYETWISPNGDPIVKATGVGLQVMSFYWFYVIVGMFVRKFKRKGNKKASY